MLEQGVTNGPKNSLPLSGGRGDDDDRHTPRTKDT